MITLLGLNNVIAVKARAEDYAPEHSFDTVIARALATIPKIIELGGHLVAESGIVLALKGKYPAAELEQLNHAGDEWQVAIEKIDVPTLSEHSRHIVILERRAE
jgi:16S rRNA (guanine527-N7)-methyltransferase